MLLQPANMSSLECHTQSHNLTLYLFCQDFGIWRGKPTEAFQRKQALLHKFLACTIPCDAKW